MPDSEPERPRRRKWMPKLSDVPAIAFFIAIAVLTVVMAGQFQLAPKLMAAIVTSAACIGAYGVLASLVSMDLGRKILVTAASVVLVVLAVLVWPVAPAPTTPVAQPSPSPSAVPSVPPSAMPSTSPASMPSASASTAKAGSPPRVSSPSKAASTSPAQSAFQVRVTPQSVSFGHSFTVSGTGTPIDQSAEDTTIHIYLDDDQDEREIGWPHPRGDGSFSISIQIDSSGRVQPVDAGKFPAIYLGAGRTTHTIVVWVWDGRQSVRTSLDPVLTVTG